MPSQHYEFLKVPLTWIGLAAFLAAYFLVLGLHISEFSPERELVDMPLVEFATVYLFVSLIFMGLLPVLIGKTKPSATLPTMLIVLAVGVVLRIFQFGAPTLLEDDYNRYLWDGAVIVAGESPYAQSPQQIENLSAADCTLCSLKEEAGGVFDRINYPQYSTVYPPVAQVAFALSYLLSPFDFRVCCLPDKNGSFENLQP